MTINAIPPAASGPVRQTATSVRADPVPVEPASAAAVSATPQDRPFRPVTSTAMAMYLMRVPASRLANAYAELRETNGPAAPTPQPPVVKTEPAADPEMSSTDIPAPTFGLSVKA